MVYELIDKKECALSTIYALQLSQKEKTNENLCVLVELLTPGAGSSSGTKGLYQLHFMLFASSQATKP